MTSKSQPSPVAPVVSPRTGDDSTVRQPPGDARRPGSPAVIEAYRHRWAAPLLDAYNRWLLHGAFARIRVAGLDSLRHESSPLIAIANHSCWWDGCVDLYLTRRVLRRRSYLMMGERELSKHRIFSAIGVFGVPDEGAAPALASIRHAVRELAAHRDESPVLWIFPQGAMLPAREEFTVRDGALLLSALSGAPIVPVAQRYEFLRDDHPEAIVRIGEPIRGLGRGEQGRATLAGAVKALLGRIDEDVAGERLSGYETVMKGTISRNLRLENWKKGKFW